jgi:hypothetical protein
MSNLEFFPVNGWADQDQLGPAAKSDRDGLFDLFDTGSEEGVSLESLAPGTVLDVTTRNTRYRFTVVGPEGQALVTGGPRFPDPTEVRIEGSTAGGRALRLGWIGVGLRLEMRMGTRTITTSTVQAIEPVAA